ncbi:MAG: siderophore biosynthesis protein, partial [Tannerellaceae bacterium]|nr:siderophore biosynthesis protein [Tannerellaceae bacterium]
MGLIFSQKQLPCWGVWKIEETIEELLAYFSDTTPFFSFLNSKAPENRKKEWLACRILLNQLLGREVLISYHSTGAPYPEDLSCYISFSHTKGYVAVIWHPDYPVGIDIEYKG